MEQEAQGTTDAPPRTPAGRTYAVGDLVHVFQGTAAYARGRNSVAYIGRIAGYNDSAGKWEVQPNPMSEFRHDYAKKTTPSNSPSISYLCPNKPDTQFTVKEMEKKKL